MNLDYALINHETSDVLRTNPNRVVLEAICRNMNTHCNLLNSRTDRYKVVPIHRATIGDDLYERAIHVRDQEHRRRQASIRYETEQSEARLRFMARSIRNA